MPSLTETIPLAPETRQSPSGPLIAVPGRAGHNPNRRRSGRKPFGALRADLRVNEGLSRVTVVALRLRQHIHRRNLCVRVLYTPLRLAAWWWVALVMGADIPACVVMGPGIRLPHGGRGVVLHPTVSIGSGVTIYHRVTIGVRGPGGAARVGDGVYIGTGASIIGEFSIHTGASVGAGAVVIRAVLSHETVVGVPARPVSSPGLLPAVFESVNHYEVFEPAEASPSAG